MREDEGKDILDGFTENKLASLFSFAVQIAGQSIDLSIIHRAAPGLYGSLPRYNQILTARLGTIKANILVLLSDIENITYQTTRISLSLTNKSSRRVDQRTLV